MSARFGVLCVVCLCIPMPPRRPRSPTPSPNHTHQQEWGKKDRHDSVGHDGYYDGSMDHWKKVRRVLFGGCRSGAFDDTPLSPPD